MAKRNTTTITSPASRTYTTEIPPRQRRFPPRLRRVRGPIFDSSELAATAKSTKTKTGRDPQPELQDTMTQYFPRIVSSSQTDEENGFEMDLDGESRMQLESGAADNTSAGADSDYEEMLLSGRKRRRVVKQKSKRSNAGVRKLVSDRKQSTLTQMPDFLVRGSGLDYDESGFEDMDGDLDGGIDGAYNFEREHSPLFRQSLTQHASSLLSTPMKSNMKFEVPSSQSPEATPLLIYEDPTSSPARSPVKNSRSPLQELSLRAVTHIDNSLTHRNPEKENEKESRKGSASKLDKPKAMFHTSLRSSQGESSRSASSSFDCIVKSEPQDEEWEDIDGEGFDQENYDPIWVPKQLLSDDEDACKPAQKARFSQATTASLSQVSLLPNKALGKIPQSPITPTSTRKRKFEQKLKISPLRQISLSRASPSPAQSPNGRPPSAFSPMSPSPNRRAVVRFGKSRRFSNAAATETPSSRSRAEAAHQSHGEGSQYPFPGDADEYFSATSSPFTSFSSANALPQLAGSNQTTSQFDNYCSGSYSPISSVQDSANILTVSQLVPDSMQLDDGEGSF